MPFQNFILFSNIQSFEIALGIVLPSKNQYQLWIVDPEGDELPVDGGVFDITQKDGKSNIPIRNALVINKPVAFVITLEQPGGVVKSKQEIVVALANS